ncbi:MAG: hypothetical protein JO358_05485 [Alphaproteobacteria bacterium]|nr:hypothetical protein [Alphaproteobacteria bacterium]
MLAAAERDMQRTRDGAIAREHPLASKQPPVFDAFDARANVPRPRRHADVGQRRISEHQLRKPTCVAKDKIICLEVEEMR